MRKISKSKLALLLAAGDKEHLYVIVHDTLMNSDNSEMTIIRYGDKSAEEKTTIPANLVYRHDLTFETQTRLVDLPFGFVRDLSKVYPQIGEWATAQFTL